MKMKKTINITQNARLEARVTPTLKNLLMKIAKKYEINLTHFIILSTKKEAELILKQQALIDLNLRYIKALLASSFENNKITDQ